MGAFDDFFTSPNEIKRRRQSEFGTELSRSLVDQGNPQPGPVLFPGTGNFEGPPQGISGLLNPSNTREMIQQMLESGDPGLIAKGQELAFSEIGRERLGGELRGASKAGDNIKNVSDKVRAIFDARQQIPNEAISTNATSNFRAIQNDILDAETSRANKADDIKSANLFAKINPGAFTPESVATFQDTQDFSTLRAIPIQAKDSVFTKETKLRGEFTKLSGEFINVRNSFTRIQESANNPTPAGNFAMVFNFMKMLDPDSVVRESEFRSAAKARAWLGRMDEEGRELPAFIRAALARAFDGNILLPEQLADFLDISEKLFSRQDLQHNQLADRYTKLAKRNKVDPRNVVIDFSQSQPKGSTSKKVIRYDRNGKQL